MRLVYFFTIGFTVLALTTIWAGRSHPPVFVGLDPSPRSTAPATGASNAYDAEAWFVSMRPFCNPVQVETQHRWSPPPKDMMGTAYSAACYSLAGKIGEARSLIEGLDGDDRWRAAGVVFNIAHPVADAGNDLAAGPIMELVVDFWPNHYMALYHAGAARYELGQHEAAEPYLESFLEHYQQNDGWTRAARDMLRRAR